MLYYVLHALGIVYGSHVAQFAASVENKSMRRGHRAVGASRRFGVAIVKIGKIEMAVTGAKFHFLERIAQIGPAQFIQTHGLGVIRHDRHQGNAFVLVIGHKLLEALLVILGGGAVVAGENDHQDFGISKVFQRVGPAIDPGQAEIWGR